MNKTCIVPSCTNTSRNSKKVFVHVNKNLKRLWCYKLDIDVDSKRQYYCCEDHLNLEEDLENYQYWKLMKGRPKLKSTASLRVACGSSAVINIPTTGVEIPGSSQQETSELQRLLLKDNMPTKPAEVHSRKKVPSRINMINAAVQCKVDTKEKSVSCKRQKKIAPVQTTPMSTTMLSSPTVSTSPSLFGCTSDTESSCVTIMEKKEKLLRKSFLKLVYENPQRYIGVPKHCLSILKDVCELNKYKVSELDLIVTLFKIKQNDSMVRISEQFEIPLSALSTIFRNGIESLANVFQNLVYLPSPTEIKKNLPLVFKIRFSNVVCIIDCFEIEIEKPSDPLRQAQTWSQYKNCNTLKYLIGCTPNGHIAFISKGYGGRISDKAIVIKSGLIDVLPPNSVIMADRGFKEIETELMTKGVKLLRPPSVYSGIKPSKAEVIKTKVIASLRVHVERVIRRIREFRLLKPHSVINHKHVSYMNHIVVIACGVINLQSEIIKSEQTAKIVLFYSQS